ncbi:reverse transcriptase/maturase family protein, partial [Billgrantia gudaonensis]
AFRDRVVHHALHRVVEPYFEARFIHHSYACRKGKGTHAATAAVQRMLRRAQAKWGTVYVLQGDIARYFPSIHQGRLLQQIQRTIGDRRVLELWRRIIAAQGADGVGLPIGALTSQLSANVYLDVLDHYVTDGLGYGLYARYMDDWIIMGPDKAALWRLLEHLTRWLDDELGLVINPKSTVYPASQGIDFAGYRTWTTHTLPRKRNVTAARRRMLGLARGYRAGRVSRDEIRGSWASFAGYTKHCQAARTRAAIAAEVRETMDS